MRRTSSYRILYLVNSKSASRCLSPRAAHGFYLFTRTKTNDEDRRNEWNVCFFRYMFNCLQARACVCVWVCLPAIWVWMIPSLFVTLQSTISFYVYVCCSFYLGSVSSVHNENKFSHMMEYMIHSLTHLRHSAFNSHCQDEIVRRAKKKKVFVGVKQQRFASNHWTRIGQRQNATKNMRRTNEWKKIRTEKTGCSLRCII